MEAAPRLLLPLLLLLRVCQGLVTCDARQNGTQCYGELGGAVMLRLLNDSSMYGLEWKKGKRTLLKKRGDIITLTEEDRSSFTLSNGTLTFRELRRYDSGQYFLSMLDKNGVLSDSYWTLRLTVQARVSRPMMSRTCSSQGEVSVSCFAGQSDDPKFSWTLDGHPISGAGLPAGNPISASVTLSRGTSGLLRCTAKNQVSRNFAELQVSVCQGFTLANCTLSNGTRIYEWVFEANNTLCVDPTTTPTPTPTTMSSTMGKEPETTVSNKPCPHLTPANQTASPIISEDSWFSRNLPAVAGSLSALVVMLLLVVAVYCAHRKKLDKRETDSGNQGEQDLAYADVSFSKHAGKRQRPEQAEAEVEYEQVRFTEAPMRKAPRPTDECVYASVCKTRK